MSICMNMSSFLCFCFYENLQELNGVRMRMNGEKDEFYFWMVEREESLFLSFSYGMVSWRLRSDGEGK